MMSESLQKQLIVQLRALAQLIARQQLNLHYVGIVLQRLINQFDAIESQD